MQAYTDKRALTPPKTAPHFNPHKHLFPNNGEFNYLQVTTVTRLQLEVNTPTSMSEHRSGCDQTLFTSTKPMIRHPP